ncbi:MAG: hypothetical protein KatS3mg035_0726 [Bacteroidia bacterium]|nr:MAG: hypothetical protein KatS3mg035_0726 [Bacteroidia bacterium]
MPQDKIDMSLLSKFFSKIKIMNGKNDYLIRQSPIFLIILNFILKVIFISSNSVGGDEPFSIYHAQLDITSIIYHLRLGNNPPLYEIILHFWIKLFNISEFSVRFPSLIFSTLTVFFIYKIGKEFFNYEIALITSLLFSFSNYHLAFSHEARVYSMFALLTAMSMYFFLIILNRIVSFKYYLLLLIVNTFLIYAHYFGFYVIIIQTISVLLFKEIRNKIFSKYLLYLLGLALLYTPNLYTFVSRFIDSYQQGTWVKSPNGLEDIYNMLWQFCNQPLTTIVAISILLIGFVKFIISPKNNNLNINHKIILIWFIFPFLFMFIISYWLPMFIGRYLIFASLGFYFVLSFCSTYIISKRKYNLILPGILVILFLVTFNPNVDNQRHVKETVLKVKELKDPNTKILICPKSFIYNFAYYYSPEIFQDIDNQNPSSKITKKLIKQNIYIINNINEINLSGCNKILFLDAACEFSFQDNNIISTLEKNYKLKHIYHFYEIFNLYEYERIKEL